MMLYAPLADTRLGAAVCGFPAYAAQPTRRERVSRGGPSGAGERAARALTQERAPRTLRRLQAGKPQRSDAGQGSAPERRPPARPPRPWEAFHGVPIRGTQPGQCKTARLTLGAQRRTRGVGARCHHTVHLPPPALVRHARAPPVPRHVQGLRPRSASTEARLVRPLALAGGQTRVAVLLVRATRPSLDAGALRHYSTNACKEGGKTTEDQ